MGAVWLAEHPEIGRQVAIKVLRPEMIRDQQLLTRFLNEARAANAIRHPNIIEILDSGSTPEGVPYLVMELLEGESLSSRVRRMGQVPLRDALEFTYQAASALAAAHAKGIIHRDLKPDNLFVIKDAHDPGRERIKVLDFGIAKLQTSVPGQEMRTRTGTLMGTPVYMSPEQCRGTRAVDQRSDIYALGIIMFEMLAGRPPFYSEGFGDLVNMHLNVPPPPVRVFNSSVPEPIERMIARALGKTPEERQQSAAELQAEIRAAAGGSLIIRGSSSPDLNTDTMQAPSPSSSFRAELPAPGRTTLQTGAGERHPISTIEVRRGGGPWKALLAIGGAAVVAVAVLAAMGRLPGLKRADVSADVTLPGKRSPSGPGPGTAEGTVAPSAPEVKVNLSSRPAGAKVVDGTTGAVLGVTPVELVRPAATAPLEVRLEKAGFETVSESVAFDRDRAQEIALPALPVAEESGGAEKGEKGAKGRDHSRPVRPVRPVRPRPAGGEDEPAKL
jgi:hypothetical protein